MLLSGYLPMGTGTLEAICWCECWKPKSDPPKEQCILLTTKPYLQSHVRVFKKV